MAQDMRVGINIDVLAKDAKAQLQSFAGFSKQQFESVRNAGMQLAAAGAAVTGLFGLTIKAASDVEEMQGKSSVVFKEQAGVVREWAKQQAVAVGRSRYALEGYAATVQDTFVPMGIAREQATELSKQVSTLAVDLASFNNVADDDAIRDLQSALVGNGETMRKYGVIVMEGTVNAELFRMGIKGGSMAATEAQKVQARLNVIMNGTKDAQGDAARTAGSFTNQMRSLQAAGKDIAVNIGNVLLPQLTTFVGLARDLANRIATLAESDLGATVIRWAAGLGAAALAVGTAMVVIGQLGIALTGLKARYAAAAIAAKASWAAMAGPVGLVIGGLAALAIAIGHATKKYRENARAAREAADAQLEAQQLGQRGMQEKIQNLDREIIVRKRVVEAIGEQLEAERRAAQELTKKYKPAELLTGGEGSEEYAKTAQRIQELSERHRMAAGDLSKMQIEAEVTRQRLALLGEEAKAAGKNVEDMGKSTEQAAAATKQATEAVTAYADAAKLAVEASDALADAKVSLQDAVNANAKTMKDAEASVVASEAAIGTAARNGAQAVIQAVKEASAARRDAARNAEQSARRIEEAEGNLTRSLRDASRSRRDMQRAEQDQLAALKRSYDDTYNGVADAQKSANDRITSAEQALAEEQYQIHKDAMIERYGEQARKAFEAYEQQKRMGELTKAVDDAKADAITQVDKARQDAADKSRELEEQRIRLLEDNAIREEDIQRNIASAQQAVTDARAAAAEQATTDAERIDAANKKVAQSFADAQAKVQEAVEKHKEAIAAYADAEVEAHKRVEGAVKSLRRAEIDLMNAVKARSDAQTVARTEGAGQEVMGVDRRLAGERSTAGVSVTSAQSRPVVINIGGNVYGDRQLEEKIVQGVSQGMRQAALSG